jgi:3-methyladenine DNA glycosylase AlkC
MKIGMNGSIQLTTEQQFQIEQFNRALETTQDPEQLRQLARQLMQAWQTQKAATCWVLKQDMPPLIAKDGS